MTFSYGLSYMRHSELYKYIYVCSYPYGLNKIIWTLKPYLSYEFAAFHD